MYGCGFRISILTCVSSFLVPSTSLLTHLFTLWTMIKWIEGTWRQICPWGTISNKNASTPSHKIWLESFFFFFSLDHLIFPFTMISMTFEDWSQWHPALSPFHAVNPDVEQKKEKRKRQRKEWKAKRGR